MENDKAKKIAKMWKEMSKNEGAYFKYLNTNGTWVMATNISPKLTSDLNRWKVTTPVIEWIAPQHEWVASYYNDSAFKTPIGSTSANSIMTRKSRIQAEKLSSKINTLAKISAWVDENDHAIYPVNHKNSNNCYYVHFSVNSGDWKSMYDFDVYHPEKVYMTREGSYELAKMLNSGTFKL